MKSFQLSIQRPNWHNANQPYKIANIGNPYFGVNPTVTDKANSKPSGHESM
jgi:hypothetical protein